MAVSGQSELADLKPAPENKNAAAGFPSDPSTLTFARHTSVFVWPSGGPADGFTNGHRERQLVDEGIAHHPFLRRTDRATAADFVLWVTVHDYQAEAGVPLPLRLSNLIVLDFADSQRPHRVAERCAPRLPYRAYFKRSWVWRRKEDAHVPLPHGAKWFPIAYSVSRAFVKEDATLTAGGGGDRPLAVTCTLRRKRGTPRRTQVLDAVQQFVTDRALPPSASQVGPVSGSLRHAGADASPYFQALRASQIVVTANHDLWEVDWRLYEAFAAGALVFADKMDIITKLLPHPIQDRVHFVEYDIDDLGGLRDALEHYADAGRAGERERIARRGYELIRQHHLPEHRLDWVMSRATGSWA